MSRRKPGRVRRKLAEMLSAALGCEIDPTDIWDNNFPHAHGLGPARWGVNTKRLTIHSWDTMGVCVAKGLVISRQRDATWDIEISAKEP